jgi:hypothetical protein
MEASGLGHFLLQENISRGFVQQSWKAGAMRDARRNIF